MPAIVLSIISYISLAVKYAPQAEQLYAEAKNLFTALFKSGQITLQQQQDVHAWMDAHQAATLAGQEPPEFVVTPAVVAQQQVSQVPGPVAAPQQIGTHVGP